MNQKPNPKFPASLRVIGRSIVDWWDSWLDMVMVMVVWLLAQVTIILGPPATFGLYHVVYHLLNGESLGVRGLIGGGRLYFGRAWLWGIINLVVAATLYVNFTFYGAVPAAWGQYVQIVVVMVGILWICTQFYTVPYFMEQDEKRLGIAMRNGLFTTLAAPIYTFILIGFSAIIGALSFGLVIPIFLGVPALIPILGHRGMLNRLEAFGLRQREKTPKEIEYEQGSRIESSNLERAGFDGKPEGIKSGEEAALPESNLQDRVGQGSPESRNDPGEARKRE